MPNERPNADVNASQLRNAAREIETALAEARRVVARLERTARVAESRLAGPGARRGLSAESIGQETSALRARNAVEAEGVTSEEARLRILQQQRAVILEQSAELRATAARAASPALQSRLIGAPDLRRASTREAIAGLQAFPLGGGQATQELRGLTAEHLRAQQAIRQTTALDSAFVGGLLRGDVTLSQFGTNMASTITKFAGWTAAAGAVFTALGAVKALGEGAKESATGVQQLTRFIDDVDRGRAAEGFRQASRDLNVPIKDVADAQAAFSRVFKDQDQSLTAARVSIAAYKLDNIAAADSQRFFTSIVQEWQLTAQSLPTIFDQVSAAQRRMGARVGEILPALARSSAAVRNTGGDLNQLVALLTTAQVASGQTGNVVGTAFSRAASNFYRRPDNAAVLRSFGLDPNKGFTQLLIDAVNKTQSLSGQQTTQLARAIGGPQFGGRIFQTLLGQKERLDKALNVTSPASAQGSAQDELHHKLAQVDEQMKAVVNGLQRFGAALGQGGAFSGLGVALRLLNLMLSGLTGIVELFDKLPASVRPWVAGLLEGYAVLRVLQRTRIGEGLADRTGIGFLGPSQQRRSQREALGVSEDLQGLYTTRVADARGRARLAAIDIQQVELARVQQTAAAQQASSAEEQVAAEERLVALTRQRAELTAQAAAAQAEADRFALLLNEEMANARTIAREGAAAAAGAAAAGGAAAAATGAEAAAAATAYEAETLAATQGRFRSAAGRVGQVGRNFANSIGGFQFGMRTLGAGFLAFTIGQAFFDSVHQSEQQVDEALKRMDEIPNSLRGLRDTLNKRPPQQNASAGIFDRLLHQRVGVLDLFPGVGPLLEQTPLGGALPGFQVGGESNQQALDQAGKAQTREIESVLRARQRTMNNTYTQVGLSNDELNQQVAADIQAFRAGQITQTELRRRMARSIRSGQRTIEALFGKGGVGEQQIRGQIQAVLSPTRGDPFSQFDQLSAAEIAKNVTAIGERSKALGATPNLRSLALAFGYSSGQLRTTSKDTDVKDLASAMDQFDQQVTTFAQDRLKDALAVATTPAQRQGAYRSAIGFVTSARRTLYQGLNAQNTQLHDAQQRLDGLERERRSPTAGLSRVGGLFSGGQGTADLDKAITDQRERVRQLKQRVKDTRGAVGREEAKLAALLQELKQQEYQDFQQHHENLLKVQQAGTQDKVAQATDAVRTYTAILGEARKLFGPHSEQFLQAYAQLLDAQNTLTDAARSRLESMNRLRTSQVQTRGPEGDISRSQSDLTGLRRVLSFDVAHHADPGQIAQDRAAINDAQRAIAQSIEDNAKAVYDSAKELQSSRTDDPVRKARLMLEEALHDVRYAHGAAGRNQALQQVAEKRRALYDAIFQADMDDAQFQHQIGQLSDDQYIQRLQDILKLKNLTKEERRRVQLELYQATHADASGFDLDVGSIKLPTIYDVREAFGFVRDTTAKQVAQRVSADRHGIGTAATAIHQDQRTYVTNNNTIQVAVTDPRAAPEVYKAIDRVLKTSARARARNARRRGRKR